MSHGKGFQQIFSIFEIFDPPSYILPWILKFTVKDFPLGTVFLRIQGKLYVKGGRKFQKSKKFVENPSHETQHPVIVAIFIVKTKNFEILLTVYCLGHFPLYFLTVKADIT